MTYFSLTVFRRRVRMDRDGLLGVGNMECSRRKGARSEDPWQANLATAKPAEGRDLLPEFQRHEFGKAPEEKAEMKLDKPGGVWHASAPHVRVAESL